MAMREQIMFGGLSSFLKAIILIKMLSFFISNGLNNNNFSELLEMKRTLD
jgi:hypothetical protein